MEGTKMNRKVYLEPKPRAQVATPRRPRKKGTNILMPPGTGKRDALLLLLLFLAILAVVVLVTETAGADASAPMEPAGSPGLVLEDPDVDVVYIPPGQLGTVAEIEDYIKSFLSTWYKAGTGKRWSEAPEIARLIVAESLAVNLDPKMLAVTVKYESGFVVQPGLGIKGKKGERGLGQLHGLARARAVTAGCDLETIRGQLRGTALWLREALETCGGDELAAFRAYQTGSCKAKTSGSILRFADLKRLRAPRVLVSNTVSK
jgi:hypothetical protein